MKVAITFWGTQSYLDYLPEWYDRLDINTYETYTMNWHGPYNGAFFIRLLNKIIEINEII